MRTWPHAPSKCVTEAGLYIITAGTYGKAPFFADEKLELLHDLLLEVAEVQAWAAMAWAVFPNHYHFIGLSPQAESPVRTLTSRVHVLSAIAANGVDDAPGRRVWYRCWDTRLTYERSVLARLSYVH